MITEKCILCFGRGFIPASIFNVRNLANIPTPPVPEVQRDDNGNMSITFTESGIPCPLCKRDELTDTQFHLLFLTLITASEDKIAQIKKLTEKNRKLERHIDIIRKKVKNLSDNL